MAFVIITAENGADNVVFLPPGSDIDILHEHIDATFIQKEEGRYEGGEVEHSIGREGWTAYEIPEELDASNFVISYSDDFSGD